MVTGEGEWGDCVTGVMRHGWARIGLWWMVEGWGDVEGDGCYDDWGKHSDERCDRVGFGCCGRGGGEV